MRTSHRRPGYTLIELLVVLAIIVILAVIIIPSTSSLSGTTKQKATADAIRGELAAARAWAMEDGEPIRVALSADGTRIRRAPEGTFADTGFDASNANAKIVEYAFEDANAKIDPGQDQQVPAAMDGWVTIAVVLPDGTCRDDGSGASNLIVDVREVFQDGNLSAPIKVSIRGITASSRILQNRRSGGSP